ncbi:hypothetical protein A2U01_0117327, partial [Trifolium medium]|nr:hypothetical protein [Trifolium medium]
MRSLTVSQDRISKISSSWRITDGDGLDREFGVSMITKVLLEMKIDILQLQIA